MSYFNLFKQEICLCYKFLFLLKIRVFVIKNHFVFHRVWALDMQSIVEFLQLSHDFLTSGNKIRSSVYILLIVSNRMSSGVCSVSLLRVIERVRFPCNPGIKVINVKYTYPIVCWINWIFALSTFDFYVV